MDIIKAGVTKVMVTDKAIADMAGMKVMEAEEVMIIMAGMADTEVMTTAVMETMVNTLSIPTIIHKRVIIISKTNNSKNFINFFCRIIR